MGDFIFLGITLMILAGLLLEKLLRRLRISNFENRHVLVTGCDTGFGNLTVKTLDKLKFKVFACCLTKDAVKKFEEMGSANIKALEMDVTKDASIEKAMEIVKRNLPDNKGLWAVVNNAGIIGGLGSIKLQTRQDYENTLAVNLYGVIMVTKACLPLVEKEKGRFINTSSILGRISLLNVSYCISKYGVQAFSDILRRDNYSTGVKVSIIEPGGFKTQILDRGSIDRLAEAKMASLSTEKRSQLPGDALERLSETIHQIGDVGCPDINLVVDAYIHAITARFPRKRYLVGFDAKYLFRILWMIPEILSDYYIERNFMKSV